MIEAFENIIQNAIIQEQTAHDFYVKMADAAKVTSVKSLFDRLGKEELKHKALLENLNLDKDIEFEQSQLEELDIVEDLLLTPLSEFKELKEAFEIAIRKEETSFEAYNRTAKLMPSGRLRALFELLANEELNHKDLVTQEYYKAMGKK
ncbi:MAG: ferritin family protein [archaeon]